MTSFMDRRAFIGALAGGLLAAPLAAEAQPAPKTARIGFLSLSTARTPTIRLIRTPRKTTSPARRPVATASFVACAFITFPHWNWSCPCWRGVPLALLHGRKRLTRESGVNHVRASG
jgi:hypothetical protein